MSLKRSILNTFIFAGGLLVADLIYTSGKNLQKKLYRDEYETKSKNMTVAQQDSLLEVMQADYRAASARYRSPQ